MPNLSLSVSDSMICRISGTPCEVRNSTRIENGGLFGFQNVVKQPEKRGYYNGSV